jgi:hypothetical protein
MEEGMNEKRSKFVPALWGGVLIGVISGVPFLDFVNCACCAGVLAGGILAVYLYKKDLPEEQVLDTNDGAILGLLAGVIGAIIASIFGLFFGPMTFDFLDKIADYTDNPELMDFLDAINRDSFGAMMVMFGFIMEVIVDSIFGLLGGLLGVALFKKKS